MTKDTSSELMAAVFVSSHGREIMSVLWYGALTRNPST